MMRTIIVSIVLFFISCGLSAQKENLLSSKYSATELQRILIPQAEWTPFPRIDDREGWAKADKDMLQMCIKSAESYIDYDWPVIPATLSLLYVRTGNRSQYETLSFKKRNVLSTLIIAEVAENRGRFLDPIINGVWSVCEESWWGVPAHLPGGKEYAGLVDVSRPFIDLFAAETGKVLAWADYFLGKKFDAVSPQIRKRIYNEITYRLLDPFMKRDHWWTGKNGSVPNNWNPWICSNLLNIVLLVEKDGQKRTGIVNEILATLDNFLNPYPQDGGCDEGPGYWNVAGASLYDNIVLLNLASNDAFRYVYENERFKNMGRYIYRAQTGENYFLNFADASPRINVDAAMVYHYGKDIGDRDMMDFGAFYHKSGGASAGIRSLYALFVQDEIKAAQRRLPYPKDVWLPDLQVMTARDMEGSSDGFYVAVKGGHNAESHNHNDVGNYVVFYDGQPLLIDVGSGKYTARTFSSRRYDIWFNCSDYHNVPTINGKTQRQGAGFKAADVSYRAGKSSVSCCLDLAKAYPKEAAVNSWKRTVTLNRGKSVVIRDVADLQKADAVAQHVMTCYPAEVMQSVGKVVIHYQTKDNKNTDFVITYNAKQMRAEVEKVTLATEEDEGIRNGWGDRIYRISFHAVAPKTKDTYSFEIRKKP
jgi:hypothetical protein